jgi:hypothetical protein
MWTSDLLQLLLLAYYKPTPRSVLRVLLHVLATKKCEHPRRSDQEQEE